MTSNTRNSRLFKFSVIANIVEWYEFSIYGFLATLIAELFFKANDPIVGVIYVFFIFALSYLVRPIGSLFFGYLSDKHNRVFSLQLATLMMSVPTFFIGLLPTYETIGFISIGLLIFLRVCQGFAAGGELPGSACLVYEAASSGKKGFFCSTVSMSSQLGMLLGTTTVALLFYFFEKSTLLEWAWRIPFLLGLPLTLVIIFLRKWISTFDPLVEAASLQERSLLSETWHYRYTILSAIAITGFIQVGFYLLFVWFPTFLTLFLHVPSSDAQFSNMIGLISLACFVLGMGYLSDFISPYRLMFFSVIGLGAVAIPVFIILPYISFWPLLASIQVLFACLLSSSSGLIFRVLGDIFPAAIRATGMSLSFTLATAILGGTSPVLCTLGISATHTIWFPGCVILGYAGVALLGLYYLSKNRSYQRRAGLSA